MKFKKIEFGRQANFFLALTLIHFLFFGYISNRYEKSIGGDILYLHKIMFNPNSFVSFIILLVIVFIMVFREDFFEYGIRNSIWLVLFIILETWLWYLFITYKLDLFNAVATFFLSLDGYITIFSLFATVLFSAILAAMAKEKYKIYKEKMKKD